MFMKNLAVVLTAIMFQAAPALGGDFSFCRFPSLTVPDQALVYAAGVYDSQETDWTLERRSGRAGLVRLAVNSPERPVILLLGAYNPTVWHIGWTEGAKILAVAVSGYHVQTVVGLPEETVVLKSAYSESSRGNYVCPYFTDAFDPKKGENLDALSRRLTGRAPDGRFGQTASGRILIGPPIPAGRPVFTAQKLNPADFDLNWPLKNFLLTAVRQNQIKPATALEYIQWMEAKNASAGQTTDSVTIPARLTSETPWSPVWAYRVVDRGFPRALAAKWPELAGGEQRIPSFFLPADFEAPPPVAGVKFLRLKDGACLGAGCGEARPEPAIFRSR